MKSVRITEAVDEYVETLRLQGRAPNTIRSRRQLVRQLLHSVGNIYLKHLTVQHVDRLFLDNPQWAPSTRAKIVAELGSFFKWAQQRRYMPNEDLLQQMRGIKVPKQKRMRLSVAQISDLLDAAANPRDRIVIALGSYMLLRGSEVRTLQWKHIRLDSFEADVWREKTDEWDEMPITSELAEELHRWRRHLVETIGFPQPEWYVAPSYRATVTTRDPATGYITSATSRLNPHTPVSRPYQAVKNALKRLGIEDDKEGVHTLRRSGARALYEALAAQGHDRAARHTQAMLGHADMTTTEKYLGLDIDRKSRNDLLKGASMFSEPATVVDMKTHRPVESARG